MDMLDRLVEIKASLSRDHASIFMLYKCCSLGLSSSAKQEIAFI